MPELFLLLLSAGVIGAAAVPAPRSVTIHWLRLAGILSLTFFGLAVFFWFGRETAGSENPAVRNVEAGLIALTGLAILAYLGVVQIDRRSLARGFGAGAFVLGVMAGTLLLNIAVEARGESPVLAMPKGLLVLLQGLTAAGVAAMSGGVLMDMLLGHAYLNSGDMTMAPFRRLNAAVGLAAGVRAVTAIGLVLVVHRMHPVPHFWGAWGLYIGTRWAVGLAIPLVFLHMAHDCVNRRATQSATGILYVAAVLIWIGEMIGLYLARETGLPF